MRPTQLLEFHHVSCSLETDNMSIRSDRDRDTRDRAPGEPASRKKTIRTYGKRGQAERDDKQPTPPSKRRRESERHPAKNDDADTPELPTIVVTAAPKPASILQYFKPVPPSSASATPVPSSDAREPPSTPPSSPPVPVRNARERRRLVTKPIVESKSIGPALESALDTIRESGQGDNSDQSKVLPARDQGQKILAESDASSLNKACTEVGDTPAKAGNKARQRRQKSQASKRQTVLSLTLGGGFTHCAQCDMAYNAWDEKDAKYHARRHASMLRRKAA